MIFEMINQILLTVLAKKVKSDFAGYVCPLEMV